MGVSRGEALLHTRAVHFRIEAAPHKQMVPTVSEQYRMWSKSGLQYLNPAIYSIAL